MSSVTLNGDTSGSVLLQAPAIAGSTTINIAAQSGTLNVAGPAFSAYLSAGQTVSASTNTKIQFNTELFDTNNCYDTSTYKFTPTVAGYYQVCIFLSTNPASTATVINLYKNGSTIQSIITQANNGITCIYNLSYLVYCNGTTDYLEFYGQCNGTTTFVGGLGYSSVQAFLARTA